jgi:hypothetical protein
VNPSIYHSLFVRLTGRTILSVSVKGVKISVDKMLSPVVMMNLFVLVCTLDFQTT